MLLRSSSTPILHSWISHSKDSSLSSEQPPEIVHQIPRTRSIVSLSLSASPSPISSKSTLTRAFSETDLRDFSVAAKKKPMSQILDEFDEDEEEGDLGFGLGASVKMASFDVDEACEAVGDGRRLSVLIGGGIGGNGGKNCGGGSGGGGSDDESSGNWDSNHGNRNIELYYQTMIEANPGNALLLSNYAKFLKEVRGDFVKAEEYCGRAILANPNDGFVLSMYADLMWRSHKDSSRAEAYFDQAIKASPDDCFVMASYAQFLWDAEDDEEEEGEGGDVEEATNETSTPHLFNGSPPLAASS